MLKLKYDSEQLILLVEAPSPFCAHRVRRFVPALMESHFILEEDRDYEMRIIESDLLIDLSISACGRFVYWRLVNHQASECEQLIINCLGNREIKDLGKKSFGWGIIYGEAK